MLANASLDVAFHDKLINNITKKESKEIKYFSSYNIYNIDSLTTQDKNYIEQFFCRITGGRWYYHKQFKFQ